jgi:hypothetical protein
MGCEMFDFLFHICRFSFSYLGFFINNIFRFELLPMVMMWIVFFWVLVPYSLISGYLRFGGTICLCLQDVVHLQVCMTSHLKTTQSTLFFSRVSFLSCFFLSYFFHTFFILFSVVFFLLYSISFIFLFFFLAFFNSLFECNVLLYILLSVFGFLHFKV